MATIANFTVEGPVGSGMVGGNPVLTGALDGNGNTVAQKVDSNGNLVITQSPTTSGGATLSKVLSAASTNATSVKDSAGQVYSYSFANTNAAYRFVHFYNKASAPAVGTDVPAFTVGIPPNFSAAADFNSGTPFVTGIAYSITTGASDTDSTAAGANDVTGFILYK